MKYPWKFHGYLFLDPEWFANWVWCGADQPMLMPIVNYQIANNILKRLKK